MLSQVSRHILCIDVLPRCGSGAIVPLVAPYVPYSRSTHPLIPLSCLLSSLASSLETLQFYKAAGGLVTSSSSNRNDPRPSHRQFSCWRIHHLVSPIFAGSVPKKCTLPTRLRPGLRHTRANTHTRCAPAACAARAACAACANCCCLCAVRLLCSPRCDTVTPSHHCGRVGGCVRRDAQPRRIIWGPTRALALGIGHCGSGYAMVGAGFGALWCLGERFASEGAGVARVALVG